MQRAHVNKRLHSDTLFYLNPDNNTTIGPVYQDANLQFFFYIYNSLNKLDVIQRKEKTKKLIDNILFLILISRKHNEWT